MIFIQKKIKSISFLLTTFQPIIGFIYLYDGDNYYNLSFLICSLYLIFSIKKFNFYFDSSIPLFILLIVCFCFYGEMFEMIGYKYNKGNIISNQNIVI